MNRVPHVMVRELTKQFFSPICRLGCQMALIIGRMGGGQKKVSDIMVYYFSSDT